MLPYELFREHYNWQHPIRSLGVRADKSGIMPIFLYSLDLFVSEEQREKQEKMDQAVDDIRQTVWLFQCAKSFYVSG